MKRLDDEEIIEIAIKILQARKIARRDLWRIYMAAKSRLSAGVRKNGSPS